MKIEILAETPPLRQDEDGTLRYGQTRLMYDLIVAAFNRGERPEDIVDSYPALALADVYTLIGYYLRHRDIIDRYVEESEREGDAVRKLIEERQGEQTGLRDRLLARRAALHPD